MANLTLSTPAFTWESQAGNESFVAADDDHDQQIGDHHDVDQAENQQHDVGLAERSRLGHQHDQFVHELEDIYSLRNDQAEIEWRLQPAAPEDETFHGLDGAAMTDHWVSLTEG
jgi:hypothetical protein